MFDVVLNSGLAVRYGTFLKRWNQKWTTVLKFRANLLSHSVMCAKSSNLSSLDLVDTISFFVSATDSWGGMK